MTELFGTSGLKGEQWEWLENNHCENQAMGRKVRPITDVTSTVLGKEEMAGRL
jgi:hypothetical protein